MSKHSSQEEYERVRARLKAKASAKEKLIQQDLTAVRKEYMPRYIKRKVITGCAIFGVTYLIEELIFRKKLPGIVKFTGALAAVVAAPKVYTFIQDNFLIVGEVESAGEIRVLLPEPARPQDHHDFNIQDVE